VSDTISAMPFFKPPAGNLTNCRGLPVVRGQQFEKHCVLAYDTKTRKQHLTSRILQGGLNCNAGIKGIPIDTAIGINQFFVTTTQY
jgi:hypothetical protein